MHGGNVNHRQFDVHNFPNDGISPYPAYKNSGIEWLGRIPAHWEVKRLKHLLAEPLKYGANEPAEHTEYNLPRYIRITDIREDGTLRDDSFRSLPENIAKPYLLVAGDILFARSGATVGKTFRYHPSWGKAAYAGYLIRARLDNIQAFSNFVEYFTQSQGYTDWLQNTFIQATIQNVSAERYASLRISIPPLPEQRAIADFLDRETARIDGLVAKKERLIELLQKKRAALISHAVTKGLDPDVSMKDSGVEWLGGVPAHWEVKRLKSFATVQLSNVDKKSKEGEDKVRLCNYVDVYYNERIDKRIDFMPATATSEQVRRFSLWSGDVVITKDSETWTDIAVPSVVSEDLPGVLCGYHLAHIRPHAHCNGGFLSRLFSAIGPRDQYHITANGITRFGLTGESIRAGVFALPPLPEQRAIAEFLDRETAKIDALVTKVKEAIDRHRELRTALISASVTGKIDVRDEAA